MINNSPARTFHPSPLDAFDGLDPDINCMDQRIDQHTDPECTCCLSVDHIDDGTPCKCACGLTW